VFAKGHGISAVALPQLRSAYKDSSRGCSMTAVSTSMIAKARSS